MIPKCLYSYLSYLSYEINICYKSSIFIHYNWNSLLVYFYTLEIKYFCCLKPVAYIGGRRDNGAPHFRTYLLRNFQKNCRKDNFSSVVPILTRINTPGPTYLTTHVNGRVDGFSEKKPKTNGFYCFFGVWHLIQAFGY